VIVEGSLPVTLDASAQKHHARRALSDVKHHLQKSALKLAGYLVAAYVVLKLIPTLKQALRSLEHVSWEWVLGAIALEVLSELGFVLAWGAIVDPQKLLDRDGRGRRTDDDVAWAQLAGGLLLPGGAWGGMGVGALILHRLGVPTKLDRRARVQPQLSQYSRRRTGADHLRCRARDQHLGRRAASSADGAAGSRPQ